jgi:protein-histidine pros-kinase
MRGYTVGEIRPLLMPHMQDTFHPQTVPAYAATQAFEKLRERRNEYTYKEATLNPTNPRDRATDWESDIVREFRNHPDREEVVGVRDTATGRSLFLARPIKITNPDCLACHSTPDAAPAAMLARYGRSNGFGWNLNEIVGAQIVAVPMTVPLEHANKAFMTFMGALLAVFAVILLVLNLMLRGIVIKPVTAMASSADEVSKGNLQAEEFRADGKDEISVLAASFNRMRRSLEKALSMLQ